MLSDKNIFFKVLSNFINVERINNLLFKIKDIRAHAHLASKKEKL